MLDMTKANKPNNDRIKFEQTDSTNCVVENEYFKIYNDTKSGKTFKVINNEVVPIELRELNMWKNRQKNPGNFTVDIIRDDKGAIYDYVISRSSSNSGAAVSAPVAPSASPIIQSAPIPPLAATTPIQSAVSRLTPPQSTAAPSPAVTTLSANAPEISRIKFEMTDSTNLVIENEFCKIYRDSKSGKTFKVINGEVAPIELKELNMWKNRQKNPQNFNVEIVKNKNGNVHDYIISRSSSSDAAPIATAAPTSPAPSVSAVTEVKPSASAPTAVASNSVAPVKSAVQPAPAPAPKAASAVTTSVNNFVTSDRIKFEETESTICVIETEFCKIYRDSKSGKTFKVINGMVAPIELRELNMWKNRQKNPQNFSVEIVKDASGADHDFIITKVDSNSVTSAVSAPVAQNSTQTKPVTSKAPTVVEGSVSRAPIAESVRTDSPSKKRKPKSTRLCKCAICGNEFNDADLFLFGNRNFCLNCIEDCVKERVQGFPVDPVEKAILDVTTADELYCTYSTVTDYPYLDEEFCVNVCTVSRAAESVIEDTTVETIDDKGVFFDDLKRFGLKKIIVNNDSSHIFSPHDFDEHVKTECVLAPKLYFKILNFLQNNDEELREKIAPVFLGSKLYTFGLTDDIVKITEDNLDEFKPLTISDGYVNFCPVFTDVTEARNVGMPFKGLYEIDAALIPDNGITHYIVNPASLAFIINKTTLEGVEPKIEADEDIVEEKPSEESTEAVSDTTETSVETSTVEENTTDEPVADAPIAEDITADEPVADAPIAEDITADEPVVTPVADQFITEEPVVSAPVADQFIAEEPIAPVEDNILTFEQEQASPVIEEEAVADSQIEETTAEVIAEKSIDDIVSDLASESDFTTSLDLSNLMMDEVIENKPQSSKMSIQHQIALTREIAGELETEGDFSVAQILGEKLNDSYRDLANLIVKADKMYAQFDEHTKHVLIDGFNRGHIFSDRAIAERSIEAFKQNGFDVYIKEYSNDELFTMLYEYKRHGIQDLVLDESANWIVISTDTISDMLDVSDSEYVSIPVTNPELMFSMTTLFQKLQSKTDNPNRKAEIASCERRMIREFTSARYILPLLAYDKDNKHPITVDNKSGVKRVLVFSDVFEMKRFFGDKFDIVQDYKILSYNDMIREFAVQENTVVVLNEGSLRFEFNEHNCDHINRVINN